MKAFSIAHFVFASLIAVALSGCASPEPQADNADGTKVAAATKCNRVVDAPLGALMKKSCAPSEDNKVDTREFMDNVQTPGAVPQSGR